MSGSKADEAGGRIISQTFFIKLTPPPCATTADTDVATAIGRDLIREAMMLIKNAGEAEGFVVDVTASQIVY